jgi:rhodanese-related sulfurtransferase
MRISDLWIDVREDDEIAVTRLPGGVRLDLGHGTAQSVTVLLPGEKAASLAAALAPEAVAS